MSAANLLVRGRAAYLIADTAGTDADGVVVGLASKVALVPRLRLAVACNGTGFGTTPELVRLSLEECADQAAALAYLPALAEGLEAMNRRDMPAAAGLPAFVQLYVAAWDAERGQPAGYIVGSSDGTFGPAYRAGTLARVSHVTSPPVPDDLAPAAGFRPAEHGRAILVAQRAAVEDAGHHRVGGWGELVTVDQAGVRREQMVTWPDRVGERISGPSGKIVRPDS